MDAEIVNKFLFPAPSSSYKEVSFAGELVWVPLEAKPPNSKDAGSFLGIYRRDQPQSFPCLFLECGTSMYILIYFHPNAEDLGRCRQFCLQLRHLLDVHVLAVEYPGYGPNPCHHASAAKAKEYASAALSFVVTTLRWPRDGILLFGSSIGTGLALHLAATEPDLAGMVLVAPFFSIRRACMELYGAAVAGLIVDPFPNDKYAAQVRVPTLIVHGKEDNVIGCDQGAALFDILQSKKALVMPRRLGHNGNLLGDENMLLRPMLRFFPLPDYCFEHVKLPWWVFRRSNEDVVVDIDAENLLQPGEARPLASEGRTFHDAEETTAQAVKFASGLCSRCAVGPSGAATAEQGKAQPMVVHRRVWL